MFAQFYDDFSDGNFTDDPTWSGLGSKFVVQSQRLKLDAAQANDYAYLTTPCSVLNDASWEFFVTLDFNPSNTNYSRVYLVSDNADLSSPLNGYFVSVGNTTDDVNLYKQSGSEYSKIIDGDDKRLDLPQVSIRIKVTRDGAGQWELLSDVGSSGTYLSEGTTTDTSHSIARYFGIFCSYTATRSDKFYFDDFIASGSPMEDNLAPTVDSVMAISANELLITFSEYLGPETAQNVQLYQVDHSIGYPTMAGHAENTNLVKLSFDGTFLIGQIYTLTVRGMRDVIGNLMDSAIRKFQYIPPTLAIPKDIIFTEVFADPSPAVGLPDQEFIELFNRSQIPYNLDGWQLTDGSSVLILRTIILPGEYLIVAPYSNELNRFGHVFSDEDFPSLNNSGDMLVIRDINDQVVDSVNYSVSWYKDDDRSSGGWSLELIDPENLCSDFGNWTASEDQSGGTPGKQNSVFANKPDLTGPMLLSAYPSSSTSLLLSFNERLEKVLPGINDFSLTPHIEIIKLVFANESLTRLQLLLADELQAGIAYTIIATTTYDCSGNSIQADFNKAVFGLPVPAEATDVVINEILFNPKPAAVDFVELVNNSQNFINLKNWSIGNMEDSIASSLKPITKQDYLLRPGTYVVLTEDLSALKGEYPSLVEDAVLELGDLPAFNDDEGSIVVMDDRQHIIDYFHYTKNLHSPFIKDEQGVSLERIALDQPTNESQNWKSASSTAGFATPGYLNSNAVSKLSSSEETVAIEPEAFVPVVGQPDFTLIRYKFDKGGYVANVRVFDDQGHFIKGIANNEVLGTEGALRWDGDRENGNPVRTGYYMVLFEVFDSAGEIRTFRKRIAIAARF